MVHVLGFDFKYVVVIVDIFDINVFVMLGGYVYIMCGLLVLFNIEDEFVVVMGYEIVHVVLWYYT